MLVLPNSQGMSVIPVLTEMTHLFGALQDPSSLTATGVAMDVMVGPSLLGSEGGGAERPSKKALPWSFLQVSSRYAHGVVYCLCGSCFSCFCP
jgi:hypothetical protein